MSASRKISFAKKNKNGGFYHNGDFYKYEKKLQVIDSFMAKWRESFPQRPTYTSIAKEERVSINTVKNYVNEYLQTGRIRDPMAEKVARAGLGREGYKFRTNLGFEAEQYLLALRSDDPSRPLFSYVDELRRQFNIHVSISYISSWWKHRFVYESSQRQTSMVPKDKFSADNWLRYYEFRSYVNYIHDHTRFNFCDEKHLVNHNGTKLKAKPDPFTEDIPTVPVDRDF